MTQTAGTKLGPYEILAPLGAGGMGEVYRALDSKLDREVAIKVLPDTVAKDPDALARFEREAKAVAALSHPNILAIHDFGKQNGTVYAVTELLEGETLRGRIDGASVSQKQAIEWCLQIAKGLSAAHGKGVVHRDLKPDNVFVSRDGHVKILDFGLAKRVDAAPEQQTNAPTGSGHTEPGTVMGTMGYMSPEQLRGLPVDHRSDIFSFGAILYELLSGKRAFKRDTASDTIAAVLKEEPPELTQTGRNISPALDHIVRHCLEKDRENRFQTAKDVAFALSEVSSPTTTTVTSGVQPVVSDRSRGKTLAIAAAALVVLAAAGALLWKRTKPGTSAAGGVRRIAVLPFENLGSPEEDYFADGIADEIRGKLTSLPGIEVIARGSSTPYKKTDKTPQEIARELSASYLLTATVRWQKGGGASRVQVRPELVEIKSEGPPSSRWQQAFDASLTDVFQVQSDIASKVAESLGVALAEGQKQQLSEKPTQNLAAYDAYLKGEEASKVMTVTDPASLRRALSYYEQAVALDPGFAGAWARVSYSCARLYFNAMPTTDLAERSRLAAEKAVAIAPMRPDGYLASGLYYRLVARDMGRSRSELEKALRLDPSNPILLAAAAGAEAAEGNFDAALQHLNRAEYLDPRSVRILMDMAGLLLRLGRTREARAAIDRGLALTPENLLLIENKAVTFLREGDLAGARAVVADAVRRVDRARLVAFFGTYNDLAWVLDREDREILLRLTPDGFDDDRGTWGIVLAQGHALQGDAEDVRLYAEEARKAFEAQLRDTPNDPTLHSLIGLSLAYLGREDEAVKEGLRSVELVSSDAMLSPYFQHVLARIYMLVGEHEKAIDELEKLQKTPYFVSSGWLKIDPNFDPLRSNPRFQKLVAATK